MPVAAHDCDRAGSPGSRVAAARSVGSGLIGRRRGAARRSRSTSAPVVDCSAAAAHGRHRRHRLSRLSGAGAVSASAACSRIDRHRFVGGDFQFFRFGRLGRPGGRPGSLAASRGGLECESSGLDRLAILHVLEDRPKGPLAGPDVGPGRDGRAQEKDARGVVCLGQESLRGVGRVPDRRRRHHGAGLAQLGRGFPPAREVGDRFLAVVSSRIGQVDADARVEVGPASPGQVARVVDHHQGRRRSAAPARSRCRRPRRATCVPSKRKTGPGPAMTLVCIEPQLAEDRNIRPRVVKPDRRLPGPHRAIAEHDIDGPSARIPVCPPSKWHESASTAGGRSPAAAGGADAFAPGSRPRCGLRASWCAGTNSRARVSSVSSVRIAVTSSSGKTASSSNLRPSIVTWPPMNCSRLESG